jgi:hypothetical protein
VHRAVRAFLTVIALVALAACDTTAPSGQPPAATSTSTSTPQANGSQPATTPGPAGPTQAPVDDLPAGAQFPDASVELRENFDGTYALLGDRIVAFGNNTKRTKPLAAVREGDGWKVSTIDEGEGYATPGNSHLVSGSFFTPAAAAANATGVVVVGIGREVDADRPAALETLAASLIWFSTDGTIFERIDPRTVLGSNESIALRDVEATPSGFLAVGSVLGHDAGAPARALILRSPDGRQWTEVARLSDRWSVAGVRLHVTPGWTVLEGVASDCDDKGMAHTTQYPVTSIRLWQSRDDGLTWAAADPAAAEPVLHAPEPSPTDEAGCPKGAGTDRTALLARFATQGSIVGMAGGALVARSADGGTVATTRDLVSWTTAALPGALAAAGVDGSPPDEPAAQAVSDEAGTIALLSLQPLRDAAETELYYGCQARWWRSSDAGATWTAGPLGRPLTTCQGGFFDFGPGPGGSMLLFAIQPPVMTTLLTGGYRMGAHGPLIPWGTCTPGPGADCRFSTLDAPGAGSGGGPVDWSGINLIAATVRGAVLPGANLTRASLSGALLEGDFSGANLRDAFLNRTTLDGDFTGADFTGAQLQRVTFGPSAICPDGEAPTVSQDPRAACRL